MKAKVWKLLGLIFIAIFAFSAANSVHAQAVTTTISGGSAPIGIAYDPKTQQLFVADYQGGDIRVISDQTNAVVDTISSDLQQYGGAPYNLAYDSGKSEMFVTDSSGVYVISDSNDAVITNIPVPFPDGSTLIAYDSGKGELFVSYPTQDIPQLYLISVISDTSNTIIANITCLPYGMVYDSAKGEIFASESNGVTGDVAVISDNTNKILTTISVAYPGSLAYDSAKGEIFVQNGTDVSVISDSSNKVVANINVGNIGFDPGGALAYDSGKGEIYVNGVNGVSVISDTTNKVVETVNTGFASPQGIAYDPGMGEIFAVNSPPEESSYVPGSVAVISDASGASASSSPIVSQSTSSTVTPSPSPSASSSPSTTTSSSTSPSAVASSSPPSNSSGSSTTLILIAVIVIIVILAVVFFVFKNRKKATKDPPQTPPAQTQVNQITQQASVQPAQTRTTENESPPPSQQEPTEPQGWREEKIQQVVNTFQMKGAISPETALTAKELGLSRIFERLIKRRRGQAKIFVEVNGKYYLDQKALEEMR